MKNITLSVSEETFDTARIIAAERKTSVSGLVRAYLDQLGRQKTRAKDAMAELRVLSETSSARLGADYKFERDEIYDR